MSRQPLISRTVTLLCTGWFAMLLCMAVPIAAAGPEAVCVPWVPSTPSVEHYTYSGAQVRLKGIARGAATEYYWDFGDGTSTAWSPIVDPYNLEAVHTYSGFVDLIFSATLYVRDGSGLVDQDAYPIRIYESSNLAVPAHLDVRINMAIDEGLWWLHKTLVRSTYPAGSPGYAQRYGYWSDPGGYPLAATGAAVDAFQLHGSRTRGNYDTDPYVETVQRAINYVLYNTYAFNISMQTYGNPDANGNGIGLVANRNGNLNDSAQTYIGGTCLAALASSDAANTVAEVGNVYVQGRSYADIVQDMVDFFSFAQVDVANGRGGWRYSANSTSGSDMSTTQWPPLGMLAAEQNMCSTVPPFVREELNYFLTAAQNMTCNNNHGGFGYTDMGSMLNCTKAGAGLISHEFLSTPLADERLAAALGYLYRHWNDTGTSWDNQRLLGNSYGMYAVMKAMRIPQPNILRVNNFDCVTHQPTAESFDWYYAPTSEPREGLAHYLVRTQQADGSWDDVTPAPNPLYDAFATGWRVLILLRGVVILPPEGVICGCDFHSYDINQDIALDGSCSFHRDPTRHIVSYEWDLNYNGVDFFADTSGLQVTITGGFPTYGTHKVALRVRDDNVGCFGQRQEDVTTCGLVVKPPPHCPQPCLADAYIGWINQPVQLDATCSWDPNNDIAAYLWDLDNDGGFDDATGPVVNRSWAADGEYIVCVQVIDATSCGLAGDYACDSEPGCSCVAGAVVSGCGRATCVRVEIGNHAPVCATTGPYTVTTNGSLQVNGCNSWDPDPGDGIDAYAWSINTGAGALNDLEICDPTFTAGPEIGEISDLCLTVWDTLGESAACCTTVEVISNGLPEARCRTIEVDVGDDCCFAAPVDDLDDGSFDPDGPQDVAEFCVTSVDGTPVNCDTSALACGAGDHLFELTIRDVMGAQADCSGTVRARDISAPGIQCPAECTVPPGGSSRPEATGSALALDNCDVTPAIAFADEYPLNQPGLLLRTWTATDASGNQSECIQTIHVEHLGWNSFDVSLTLTANQPTYWSAFSGLPATGGVPPFSSLDPGIPPGRPDPEGSGERVLRGYLLAWAVNLTGEEIRWNHLAGGATVINYDLGTAWQYPAYAFQVVNPAIANGAATGTPGELFLDGAEYDSGFDLLLLDFYATGSQPFTQNGTSILDTDLTLLPVDVDLRQETDGPVTTKASFTVWNMNETKFTGMDRCITCWDELLLGLYEAPDYFLIANLQTAKGKAQIAGLASQLCDFDFDPGDTCTQKFGGAAPACDPRDVLSQAASLLGVTAKQIAFSAVGPYDAAGMNLVGMGTQSATIRFDVISIPPERPQGHVRTATTLQSAALAEEDASTSSQPPIALAPTDRTSVSDKGSLLIYPKIELRWDASGTTLIQDTFIDLVNDFPEDVSVQLYYINGDPPVEL